MAGWLCGGCLAETLPGCPWGSLLCRGGADGHMDESLLGDKPGTAQEAEASLLSIAWGSGQSPARPPGVFHYWLF